MSQKTNLFKTLPVIILATLLVVVIISAWQEPTAPPPGGNVPAPLSVGTTDQIKLGALSVPILYDTDNPSYFINPGGSAGVSAILGESVSIGGNLDVSGGIKRDGNTVWDAGNDGDGSGLDADTVDGYEATTLLSAGQYNIWLSKDVIPTVAGFSPSPISYITDGELNEFTTQPGWNYWNPGYITLNLGELYFVYASAYISSIEERGGHWISLEISIDGATYYSIASIGDGATGFIHGNGLARYVRISCLSNSGYSATLKAVELSVFGYLY